ncbi:uncharacterized protein LOC128878533 [Hylaeus volcanicus]|uniref:uncharacterized protein LOC128878533 n=1 Tax=Hylaeus volcanicus TaxID=313075 RepID=UPI0023B7C0FA|nr:uncharacterized protein LOC128878533 [Hylaeus volcanicus]
MSSSEDELIICVAAATIVCEESRKHQRRWWMRAIFKERARAPLLDQLQMENGSGFRNFSRMTRSDFEFLTNSIGAKIARKDTFFRQSISITDRLLITLRFLATRDSFQSLSYMFRVSKQCISLIVPDVCEALIDALKDVVKEKTNFPRCVSAIDGKHIILQAPMNSGSKFYNYKGTFSVGNILDTDGTHNVMEAFRRRFSRDTVSRY